ncbi:hypothetical protein DFO56_11437 [Kosakonia sp. AG348]|nr:hypothetical protein DFO56_11437 [Kosakonia sp. AG348]
MQKISDSSVGTQRNKLGFRPLNSLTQRDGEYSGSLTTSKAISMRR